MAPSVRGQDAGRRRDAVSERRAPERVAVREPDAPERRGAERADDYWKVPRVSKLCDAERKNSWESRGGTKSSYPWLDARGSQHASGERRPRWRRSARATAEATTSRSASAARKTEEDQLTFKEEDLD